jgi:rhomboid family GlyGly-CTERM serine protease
MACVGPRDGLSPAVVSKEKLTGRKAFPWATLALALVAVLALVFQSVFEKLIYDRSLIFRGQVWRCWTGHVAHYGLSHLFWNLAVFVPAGCWLERLWPRGGRWFYAVCPPVISLALLWLDPSLIRYAGLSGLATGVLILLAGRQLSGKNHEPAWLWLGVLALVGAKIVLELITGAPLMVSGFAGIRTVPLAHLGGLICGGFFLVIARLQISWTPAEPPATSDNGTKKQNGVAGKNN